MTEFVLREQRHRDSAISLINSLDLKHAWKIVVCRYVKSRSNPQLGLYWSWMKIIADDTGNDTDDLHDFFKQKFLAPHAYEIAGETKLSYSTGKLTAKAMSEYMERVMAFAASELGIALPLPEDLQRAA